jgi:hypothetical protein
LKKRAEDIDKEYNNKIKNFASSSIYQDVYSGPKISGTFKLGEKTFTVGSNPQLNVKSLEQERVKKIDQVDKIAAAQKNKLVTGAKKQKLLTDNEYVQTVLTDELEGLKSDRQYYATLASNPKNILENTEAPGFDLGNIFSAISGQPSLKNNPVKPEILQSLNIQTTGDNKKDYALVQKVLANKVSTIDANITQKTQDLGLSRTDTKNLRNQVDYLANMLDFTDSEAVFSAARLNPKIAKQEEEISKNVGEVTTIDMPSAEAGKLTSAKGALVSSILNILPTGLGGNTASLLSGLYNMSKEGFSKKASYLNLNEEKKQLTNYDAAYQTIGKTNELRLTKTYDDLTNQFQVPKEKIKSLALALLNVPNNTKPQFADVQDQALFEGIFDNKVSRDKFLNIVNTYGNTSREFDVEGKKMRLSLAEANKITALKAKEFGTLQKFQSDIEKEQAYVDVMNKKSKDASIISNDFFNKLAYETAYSLTRGKATTQDIVGGAAKVGQTIYEDVLKGEVSDLTKSNIDELIKSTDLFDVFVPTNSALQLGLFNTNKFIPIKDQSGKNISIEVTPQGDVKNIHAEDYTYIIRDPKQKQAIIDYYNQNKEELLNSAVTLSKTEGGKRAIFDNTVRNVENQLIDEVPILAFELVAGGGTGALLANTDKMRKISQYAIAATSNMLETYPMIYKGYEEDTNDPNNPYAAMLTTGALGMVSLLTSGLDRRLIGLGQNAVSKEILPNVITNSAPIIKAISKETLKISDKSIREIAFKSAVNKAMIKEAMNAMKPAFKTAMSKGRQTLGEQVAEIGEEVGTEPLTRYVTNFLNSAILGNQAYKQKTLDELDFLNPETAWLTFWTAGAISSAGNIAQSIQNNNPYTQVDYVKAALKKPDEVMKMLDNISDENPPEVIQKIKDDYNALQNSYQTKKKDLNISQDLLESLDFNNPAVQIVMSQAGINKAVVDNIRGNKNYDALLIQQVLEEKKAKDLETEIQDGISQGLIMETESGYKAVGNNPLSKPYEKTIADFQKANNNIQYFNNFITEFNNKTAPVQRQFVNELQKSLAAAPDLYDVKQENEDESSLYYNVNDFNTLRTNTLSKLLNETRLTEINSEISDKKSENKDVEKLQQEKEEVTKAITESTNAINLIQQQYKPGRTETDEELKKTTDTNRLAQIELATVIDAVSRMQDIDNLDLDNHEINDIYEKYNQTVKDRNQVVSKLKKEYKVDVPMQPEITPEQFSEIKQTITRKYNLGKNIESGKGNLADLTEYVDLSTNLGVINPDETLQEPESSEDIDDIVNDPQQLVMQAKAMNLSPLLSALNVKKRVASKLHAQLNEAEQEKTLGINEILNTKIDQTSGQNTTYVIDGKEYTIANRPNSNTTTISEQQKSQIILDELGREVARRIFSESMDLNPNTVETIMNKVISESYPELALELDENTLRLISANILKLKIELENQGFNILFNDKVISSVFATPSEADNAVVGIASKIPLIAVSPEGNIHLINFKLFTGSTADNLGIFNEEMTVLESLFKDNDVNITGIHMLPIKVKTTFKDNILKVEKTSLDFRETDNSVSPSLIQLQTDVVLENDILTNLGTNAVEEEIIVEETPTDIEAKKADIEKRRQKELSANTKFTEVTKGVVGAEEEVAKEINAKYDAELAALEPQVAKKPINNFKEIRRGEYSDGTDTLYIVPTSNSDMEGYIEISKDVYDEWKKLDDEEKDIKENLTKRKESLITSLQQEPDLKTRNYLEGIISQINGNLKANAFQYAAEKRKVLGTLTSIEKNKTKEKESKVLLDDSVEINNVKYTVIGFPFGRIKVRVVSDEGTKEMTIEKNDDIAKKIIEEKATPSISEKGNLIPNLEEYFLKLSKEKTANQKAEIAPIVEETKVEVPITPEPQVVIEPTITPEAEIDIDSEEVEPVSASPTYNVGGTTNGVYITVVERKLANGSVIYKIQIENDPDLNAEYKNKNFKSEGEVKAEYAKKGWFVPEKIITNTAYSLQDSEGNSIKSPISPITSDKINNLSFVSEGRGQEVTIEEQDETMNDDASIQSNFANKANLVIKSGDEIIAVVPFNSTIRRKLQTITVDGKMRLAPTTAKINKVIQKDFDRTAPVTLGNWLLDFSKANGAYTYDVGYVQYDNKKETFVLKNTKDKTIFIYSPEKQPTLGATYLIVKDENGKETRFALQTPKLRDVVLNDGSKPTREEIINLMQLIPNQFKTESGRKLYTNIINGLRTVIANSTNPRIIEIADLVAKELGAEETLGRAESTAEQLATLDYLPSYSPETKKEIEETIADFFLNRIITLTENSIPKHIITTNPETVFLDNTLEVNDLVSGDYSEEAVKLQGLSDEEFLNLVTSKGMVQINPDCL